MDDQEQEDIENGLREVIQRNDALVQMLRGRGLVAIKQVAELAQARRALASVVDCQRERHNLLLQAERDDRLQSRQKSDLRRKQREERSAAVAKGEKHEHRGLKRRKPTPRRPKW